MLNSLSDEDLQRLGLTILQAEVILVLYELGGEATAPDIVEKLSVHHKVNRTSIYTILNKLEQLNLVFKDTSSENRSTYYSVTTMSPSMLVEKLLNPQKKIITELKNQLQEAKNRNKISGMRHEFYQLRHAYQIEEQVELLLTECKDYILILATSLSLQRIFPIVKTKSAEVDIYIQPTWNPDPKLGFENLITKYRQTLGVERVNQPLPIFEKIIPIMKKIAGKYKLNIIELSQSTHFIQIIGDAGMLIGGYFGEEGNEISSGIYSREPVVSQMYQIIFTSLFLNQSSNEEIINTIGHKLKTNFALFEDEIS